jgi:hypothetical protein
MNPERNGQKREIRLEKRVRSAEAKTWRFQDVFRCEGREFENLTCTVASNG